MLDAALGGYRGQGNDEQTLLRTLLDTLESGEQREGMRITRASSCSALFPARGVEAVFEQQGSRRRSTDFRRGRRLGARDHLIELPKPKRKPDWMTPVEYAQAPETLTVRELATGAKILVTTLLCPTTQSRPEGALS